MYINNPLIMYIEPTFYFVSFGKITDFLLTVQQNRWKILQLAKNQPVERGLGHALGRFLQVGGRYCRKAFGSMVN